jgi:hypothetical protein
MSQMTKWSGFYPATPEMCARFEELMLHDTAMVDVLGTWLYNERFVPLPKDVVRIKLPLLEPWHAERPWTRCLKGKRVLVIHPFAKSIMSQYARREKLFVHPDILPEFASLRVIPAVQSLGGHCTRFSNWFEALDWMKQEMDKTAYDVVLIGCGAYGFPLAAHAKRTGHQAVHLGGALQLLFGILGKRWEDEAQSSGWNLPAGSYSRLFNEYWVRPASDETPSAAPSVEGGCYW